MKKITARQLKNETGRALQMASRGEKLLITRRGKPVAWLVKATESPNEDLDEDEAWQEITAALAEQKPAFKDWQTAVSWSRGRA